MMIQLCKVAVGRLGAGADLLLSALREREHTPVVKDCLDRCTVCETGLLVAVADGTPLQPPTPVGLLQRIDELQDEEDGA